MSGITSGPVKLLLHGDGTVGGTTFTDSSAAARAISKSGSVVTGAGAGGAFGQAITFSSGGYLKAPASADFSFGSNDFSIHGFIKPTSFSRYSALFACDNIGGTRGWNIAINGDAGGKLAFSCWVGSTGYTVSSPAAISSGTRIHFAVCRSGSSLMLFLNGSLVATTSISGAINTAAASYPLFIGALQTGGAPYTDSDFRGDMDELVIENGFARYTSNFTVPTEPFWLLSFTLTGVVRDGTDAVAARVVRAYNEAGALVGSTTSDAGTGVYVIRSLANAPHTLVFEPASGEALNSIILRGVSPVFA